MTDNEVSQILKAIEKLQTSIDRDHMLLVGNGNTRAVLPRLQALEFFTKWLKNGLKVLLSIVTALIIAGLIWLFFGSP